MIYPDIISYTDADDVVEPVGLSEVKDWLQITTNDYNALLTSMIPGARQTVEGWLNGPLVPKNVVVLISRPEPSWLDYKVKDTYVHLWYGGDKSDIVVKSIGSDGALTTIDPSNYSLTGPYLNIGFGDYQVSYVVTPSVPEGLKEAVKMEVAHRFQDRGENTNDYRTGLSEAARAKAFQFAIPAI